MSNKKLSPDAQIIMEALYRLLNLMEEHELKYKHSKKYLDKNGLERFIKHLEKKLGIISIR